MEMPYEIAVGSVPGWRHVGRNGLLVGRNNQDAVAWRDGPGYLVGVVCDGCSSGDESELGARLGARWVVDAVGREVRDGGWDAGTVVEREAGLERVRLRVLRRLRSLLPTLGDEPARVMEQALLFTVILAVLTPHRVTVAGLGDGAAYLNEDPLPVPTFPGNAPPYLAYGLLPTPPGGLSAADLRFGVLADRPARGVNHVLIGTDGVADLEGAAGARLPGRAETLGPVSQFWTGDRFFRNPDALRRWLALANSEVVRWDAGAQRLERRTGLLPDDTTLWVARRREGSP